ncbi:MAG: translation elongation factor Ts [Eubacteriales bacterium]|jgi:elongation factor Ts
MANITAKDVADLRAKTNAGIMECKKALVDAGGDMDKAIKLLRERGLVAQAKKESRIAADGLVSIRKVGDVAAMIEVNTETDFVAKNDMFKAYVDNLLGIIIEKRPKDVAELLTLPYPESDFTVETKLQDLILVIKEKITIRRFVIVEGITSNYTHGMGAIGVIVRFDADKNVAEKPEFEEFAKNIALQVCAYPVAYLDRDSVPSDVLEEEKTILMTQIKNDPANAKKPQQIIEKMVLGRLGKFYENNCLLEQGYVKDDALKVSQYIAATAKELGGNIKVTGFWRYEKGEGIQKREDNFAEEIAKLTGQQ